MKVIDPITGVKKQVTFDKNHKPVFTVVKGDLDNKDNDVPVEEKEDFNGLEISSKGMRFEAWYPELPDLLFGCKDGFSFFNASDFQRRRKTNKDIRKFLSSTPCIKVYAEKLGADKLVRFSDSGDVLLHEVLAIAYIEFVDPKFSIWMHDRMHELMYNGMVVSDNYLAVAAKRRLPRNVLEKLIAK